MIMRREVQLKNGGYTSDIFAELPNMRDLLIQLATETQPEHTQNHKICFFTNNDGKPLKTLDNFKILLQYYGIDVRDNSATGLEFSGNLPKMTDENIMNVTFTHLYSMARETGINFSKTEISDYSAALADANHYNPVKTWLNTLDINARGYIKKYFDCLLFEKSEEENKKMYLTFFKKWLIQCIAMQFNCIQKPIGADGALGLQSKNEGIGKTSFFRNLCFESQFFKDGINIDPSNKDSVIKATSFWISELGEIESTLSKDLAKLKAFITEDYDTYRMPYATGLTTKPRRTSFCFTCNSQYFLKDGDNRRFWVIPIVGVDLPKLKSIDIKGVWGEAYSKYLKNPQEFRLGREELLWLKENNREKFSCRSNEEEVLRDKLDFFKHYNEWSYMASTDISALLFEDKRHARVIGKILSEKLGYQPQNGNNARHYRVVHGKKEYFVPLR